MMFDRFITLILNSPTMSVTRAEFDELSSKVETLKESHDGLARITQGLINSLDQFLSNAPEEASVVFLYEVLPAADQPLATAENSPNVMPERKRDSKAASKEGVRPYNCHLSNHLLNLKLIKK